MADQLALGVIGAAALTEGVKFLYGQAAEVLNRWRDRRKVEAEGKAEIKEVAIQAPSGLLTGQLGRARIDGAALARLAPQMQELSSFLTHYVTGTKPISTADEDLLAVAEALRQSLEAVYRQRFTFVGEPRPPSGPLIVGGAQVRDVEGFVAGVRARVMRSGEVHGSVEADRVAPGSSAFGVDVDTIE